MTEKIIRPTDLTYWYPFKNYKESPWKDVVQPNINIKLPSLEKDKKK